MDAPLEDAPMDLANAQVRLRFVECSRLCIAHMVIPLGFDSNLRDIE